MSLSTGSARFNIADTDNVVIEIGAVVHRSEHESKRIVTESQRWDSTLLRLFRVDIRGVQLHTIVLSMLSSTVKLAEACSEYLRRLIEQYGSFYEVRIGQDISCSTPIISLVTGLEPRVLSELCEVPQVVKEHVMEILNKLACDDPASCMHALLHTSSLVLALLETQYAAEMSVRGCIQEGDICATHPLLTDSTVRGIGVDIVSGTIPGIVIMTCTTRQIDVNAVAKVVSALAQRNFLVIVAGLLARILETHPVEGEQTVFDLYPDKVIKCVPLLGALHYAGVLIRAAEIFAGKKITGNLVDIANYIFTKIGVAAIIWGPPKLELLPLALGLCRLGVPVILYPEPPPLLITGKLDEKWTAQDTRTGKIVEVEHSPPHLLAYVNTLEDLILLVVRSCLRLCDNSRCRLAKLSHYVDFWVRLRGRLPDDLPELIRTETEIPLSIREEVKRLLAERGWSEREVYTDLSLTTPQSR